MRKILFLAIMTVACAITNAQMTLGLKGGLNLSNFSPKSTYEKSLANFNFGIYGNYAISKKVSIQPELFYNAIGSTNEEPNKPKETMKVNYISLPILGKYHLSDGTTTLFFGPQISFLSSAKYAYGTISVDASKVIEPTDFSLVLGIGYDFPKNFGLNLRSQLGLNNINKSNTGVAKNSVVSLSLSYKLQ